VLWISVIPTQNIQATGGRFSASYESMPAICHYAQHSPSIESKLITCRGSESELRGRSPNRQVLKEARKGRTAAMMDESKADYG